MLVPEVCLPEVRKLVYRLVLDFEINTLYFDTLIVAIDQLRISYKLSYNDFVASSVFLCAATGPLWAWH